MRQPQKRGYQSEPPDKIKAQPTPSAVYIGVRQTSRWNDKTVVNLHSLKVPMYNHHSIHSQCVFCSAANDSFQSFSPAQFIEPLLAQTLYTKKHIHLVAIDNWTASHRKKDLNFLRRKKSIGTRITTYNVSVFFAENPLATSSKRVTRFVQFFFNVNRAESIKTIFYF